MQRMLVSPTLNDPGKPRKPARGPALRFMALYVAALAGVVVLAPSCLDRPIEPVEPRTTSVIVERLTQSAVNKIDILLMIDNSRSMQDKQDILRVAVPDLVRQLVNPKCLDVAGNPLPDAQQPADPLAECPAVCDGAICEREFDPIADMHIGIITSSLGGHGADSCGTDAENERGRLINRTASGTSGDVPGWNGTAFLVWDPDTANPSHNPPGDTDLTALSDKLTTMVGGAGEVGCGYEAQLEAWYRFLVDPDPYESVVVQNGQAVLQGTDMEVINQRAQFLRPDSLLAIVMLTDENDCSIRDGSIYWNVARIEGGGGYRMPKARPACATDPNSPCCRSCGQPPADGCGADTQACDANGDGNPDALAEIDDQVNLRCYDQKRRFGLDFLYPITRYLEGLGSPTVPDRAGNPVPNPIFSDLDPSDDASSVRDQGLVFVAGIVGVPWQDLARKNAAGDPDLLNGCAGPCADDGSNAVGGFQSATEMLQAGTWATILGDPSCYNTNAGCLPQDPLMIESIEPRTGTQPITGEALQAPPGPASGPDAGRNSINGSEWTIEDRDDLQYACIFERRDAETLDPAAPYDCAAVTGPCDCKLNGDGQTDNPLCDTTTLTNQIRAKAYPGVRELSLLKNAGAQGIVGSICPAQQTNNAPDAIDFGYRPAINAIVERLKQALGGQCLPRALTPNANGQVPCLILEASRVNDCAAACSLPGRAPLADNNPAVKAAKEDPLFQTAQWNCFCEIQQLEGPALEACQNDPNDPPSLNGSSLEEGFCYVSAASVPPVGNEQIVADCPPTERQIIRLLSEAAPGATLFITCSGG
jgi:hypothetical protein